MELVTPIEHGGEKISDITLRAINAGDVMALGWHIRFRGGEDGTTDTIIDTKTIGNYIVRLSALPPSVIAQLSLPDFTALQGEVVDQLNVALPGEKKI